jgi:2,3-bisphosphoglycerate-dependent phosphoglycerate mutase
MQLYLIRHGQSTNNALRDPARRHYDCDLTDLGRQQAVHLAHFLSTARDSSHTNGFTFTHLYCSPMRRTMQTTQPIAATLNLTPQVWVDLHEVDGVYLEDEVGNITGYSGMSRVQMQAEFPGYVLPEDVTDAGWWDPAWGKESVPAHTQRAIRVSSELWAMAGSDAQVAVVSHAAFIALLLEALMGHLPRNGRPQIFLHENTAITRLELTEGRLRIGYTNRVDHLPLELRSF